METVFLLTDSCDQDQLVGDQPQVATSLVGPPPTNPPPPPPGDGGKHADEVIEPWASDLDSNNANDANVGRSPTGEHDDSDDDVSNSDFSNQASSDSDEDASEASEDAISVLAQTAVEEVMEAAVRQVETNSPTCFTLGSRPQPYRDSEDSDDSQDEGGWRFEDSPPPTLHHLTSRHSTGDTLPSTPSKNEENDDEPLQEVIEETTEVCPRTS